MPAFRSFILRAASLLMLTAAAPLATAQSAIEAGRAIYEEGRLVDGSPLQAQWPGGVSVSGREAACVQCHRPSGMGMLEGGTVVPPVAGPLLFNPRAGAIGGATPRRAANVRYADHHFNRRPAYDGAALARALREGVTPGGHQMAYLMPRYAIGEADVAALEGYLRSLPTDPSPGASPELMHFATVLTPGSDPARRKDVVDVLSACFAERYPADRVRGMRWRLHVWQLEGPAQDWPRQLDARMAAQPVFALASGLGAADWAPVHQFCESRQVPCVFPNVDVPGGPVPSRYGFYFSEGTRLEGALLARWLSTQAPESGRIVQVVARGDDAARAAAQALRATLPGHTIEDRLVEAESVQAMQAALAALSPEDDLVLWLPRAALARLVAAMPQPPATRRLMASGWLTQAERWLVAPAWRERLVMPYLLDPPARRNQRFAFNLRPWLSAQGIAPSDEDLAGNTLTACNLLTDSVARLRGTLLRDLLVENLETYPAAMGNAPAPQAFASFSLGTDQRVSAKGGAIVRFASPDGSALVPIEPWIVP